MHSLLPSYNLFSSLVTRFMKFAKIKLVKAKKLKDVESSGSTEEFNALQEKAKKKLDRRFAGEDGLLPLL